MPSDRAKRKPIHPLLLAEVVHVRSIKGQSQGCRRDEASSSSKSHFSVASPVASATSGGVLTYWAGYTPYFSWMCCLSLFATVDSS